MKLNGIPVIVEEDAIVELSAGIPQIEVYRAIHIDIGIQIEIIAAGRHTSVAYLL